MIELYSRNILVSNNATIPLNVVNVRKGRCAIESGAGSVNLNKCGVYVVTANANVTSTDAGVITMQLQVNGVPQQQAIASETIAAAGDIVNIGFTTLVQVTDNNGCGCCNAPTTLVLENTGIGATYNTVDLVVYKLN